LGKPHSTLLAAVDVTQLRTQMVCHVCSAYRVNGPTFVRNGWSIDLPAGEVKGIDTSIMGPGARQYEEDRGS
jgi:hypothetical protein